MTFLKSMSTVARSFGALLASLGALVAPVAQGSIEQRVFVDDARNQVIKLEWVSDSIITSSLRQALIAKALSRSTCPR